MSGSIVRALHWDSGYEQQFLAVNPIGDEVVLYQTNHEDPASKASELLKVSSRLGFESIQCSSYLGVNKGITGVGTISGNISVFDINSPTSSVLRLRPKQSRPCNALSFNNSNLVAAGFDKGRQDNSLQIWNVEHYSRNSTNDHIKRPMATYLPNEAVLSATFYPDLTHNLVCGSYKFLREIDLRQEQPVFQMASKYTLGLTVDHFQNHLFHSFSEDGSLAIWDRRRLSTTNAKAKVAETPVLQFHKLLSDTSARKNQNPCVRYLTIRRGEFASVFNGDLIRRWGTATVPALDTAQQSSTVGGAVSAPKDAGVLQSLKQQSSQLYRPHEESLFVSCVLDVKTDYERVVSFDYSPDVSSHTSTHFVCMRQSGSVFRMPVLELIDTLDFNSFNEFTIGGTIGTSTKFMSDKDSVQGAPRGLAPDIHDGYDPLRESFRESEVESIADDDSFGYAAAPRNEETFIPKFLDILNVIANDIGSSIRRRALLGYGVEPESNIRVLEKLNILDNQLFLRNTWKWLSLAKKSLDKGTMVSEGVDLGYQGVLGIWKGVEELKRLEALSNHITDEMFARSVKLIVLLKGKKTAGITIPGSSERKTQRKLCLIVSGWYLTDTEFDDKLKVLINLGYTEKAAGWAVFHGDVRKAIEILSNSNKERLRLMSTAVAGYLAYKNDLVNSPWKDQCRRMALDLDDPYLRAIFAFIADNDWWDVLDEHSLPLRERLGVALRFLLDKDLNVYLHRVADTVVTKGELEGLILTGITPRGIDLLQSFVDRTSDVQTAALISAYACPRYFADNRVKHWVDCYRNLLNSWGFFSVRAKFDVARTKLSRNTSGQITIKATPKQVYLQCIRCNKNIGKRAGNGAAVGVGSSAQVMLKQFNKMNKANTTVTACPHCGAPLPRCSICLLNMGTPLPTEPADRLLELNLAGRIENRFREWFSFCLNCNHGLHAHHADEWFLKHFVCPVPDCNCRCNSR